MPEILTASLSPSCSPLFSGPGNQRFQRLGPDPYSPRARDARERFGGGAPATRAAGTSGLASADKLNAFDPANGKVRAVRRPGPLRGRRRLREQCQLQEQVIEAARPRRSAQERHPLPVQGGPCCMTPLTRRRSGACKGAFVKRGGGKEAIGGHAQISFRSGPGLAQWR
jgi:hypothetical protein